MVCQSVNPTRISMLTVLLAIVALAMPVAAQSQLDPGTSLAIELVVAVGITLVFGGGLIVLAPDYASRTTRQIHNQPLRTFLYGFGLSILLGIVIAILVFTVFGILFAIPLVLGLLIVAELGFLAAGRAVSDSWGAALLVAVVASAFTAVPILGALVAFVLGSCGIGAAYIDFRGGSPSRPQETRKSNLESTHPRNRR